MPDVKAAADAPADAGGGIGGGQVEPGSGATPTKPRDSLLDRHRRELIWAIAAALALRGVLGVADAISISQGGLRVIPIGAAVGLGAGSPLWSMLWAALALAAAAGLLARFPLGWALGIAASLAYLAAGIGDLGLVGTDAPLTSGSFWLLFVADVLVPGVVLMGLVRLWPLLMQGAARRRLPRSGSRTSRRVRAPGSEPAPRR